MIGKTKQCPRCKKKFICEKENISACICSRISLSNETKSYLSKTFYDCHCTECMLALDQLVAKIKQVPFPERGGDLIEGIHYYKEEDYRVFTEFYHISRGYCCRSGCRHCAYGFKKKYAE